MKVRVYSVLRYVDHFTISYFIDSSLGYIQTTTKGVRRNKWINYKFINYLKISKRPISGINKTYDIRQIKDVREFTHQLLLNISLFCIFDDETREIVETYRKEWTH